MGTGCSSDRSAVASPAAAAKAAREAAAAEARRKKIESLPVYSAEDVFSHKSRESCWLLIHGLVYDVSQYIADGMHPGGSDVLLRAAGQDASADFDEAHHPPEVIANEVDDFLIGRVAPAATEGSSEVVPVNSVPAPAAVPTSVAEVAPAAGTTPAEAPSSSPVPAPAPSDAVTAVDADPAAVAPSEQH